MFLFYYTAKIVVFFISAINTEIFLCKNVNIQMRKRIKVFLNKNIKAFLCGYIK